MCALALKLCVGSVQDVASCMRITGERFLCQIIFKMFRLPVLLRYRFITLIETSCLYLLLCPTIRCLKEMFLSDAW